MISYTEAKTISRTVTMPCTSYLSQMLVVPALLHQTAVSERPHNPQREDHDDDEGQKELSDGEKEEL